MQQHNEKLAQVTGNVVIVGKSRLPPAISRHTHATFMLAAGNHPKVAAERLGHSRVSLIMDRYTHLLPTLQEGAAVAVEEVLKDEE